ncbi:hypothetical protein T440DRAFT_463078 [Plenodomus tracheiphilus IPT5]|uniref:molybdopterin adenylyltransferase n=1 Tax=Plenodomus tracheiphilus IPT5 TaxID=1408161 RepID=A0A6A7BN38_9PLEO|nr:hypothetical protein T440DRAFT_463078 [Plenodomus tracheiphilus IPT5]
MAIAYEEALGILRDIADSCKTELHGLSRTVPLLESLGHVAARDHVSALTTPPHDTSAMDGYAVSSEFTSDASPDNPAIFNIRGTIAAGQEPIELVNEAGEDGVSPCVEIMTGAQFPHASRRAFDACVKIEDTIDLGPSTVRAGFKSMKRIAVTRPLRPNANRRFAGKDLQEGDVILRKGDLVCSRHVMALASVGITAIDVCRKFRVALWATGDELSEGKDVRSDSQIWNSNGPFLCAALQELGIDVEYKGILRDDPGSLHTALDISDGNRYDMVITTGAVSKGKFDFVVPALQELKANIQFHGVAIRPGHPVLFATMEREEKMVPIFGLPGNPIATAACFRFLVVPFIDHALTRAYKKPLIARLPRTSGNAEALVSSPPHLDCFRHGTLQVDSEGDIFVELSGNQSPAIISQFAASNCWVHLPRNSTRDLAKIVVHCYPHRPLFK